MGGMNRADAGYLGAASANPYVLGKAGFDLMLSGVRDCYRNNPQRVRLSGMIRRRHCAFAALP